MTNVSRLGTAAEIATRSKFWVMTLIVLAMIDNSYDFSLLNIALPAIGKELSLGPATLQWSVTASFLAFGGLVVLGGKLVDLYGEKTILTVGLVLTVLGSFVGLFAQGIAMLIVARLIQGVGRAALNPATLALLAREYSHGKLRDRALAILMMVQATSAPLGLMLGTWLVDSYGWRSVMIVSMVVCAASMAVAFLIPSHPAPRKEGRIDGVGAALSALAMAGPMVGLTGVAHHGWWSPYSTVPLAIGILSFFAFLIVEDRVKTPLVPLTIFKRENVLAGIITVGTSGGGLAGLLTVLIYSLRTLHHYGALQLGLAIAPFGIGAVVARVIGPWFSQKVKAKTLVMTGVITLLAGDLWLWAMTEHAFYWIAVLPPLFLVGTVTVLGMTVALSEMLHGVPPNERGIVSAFMHASQQTAVAAYVAIVLTVIGLAMEAQGKVPSAATITVGWLAAAAVGALGAVFIFFLMTSSPPQELRPSHH